MQRFAAIDMGSNASRLLVVEAHSVDQQHVVAYRRVPVRLGHSVFVTGKLDEVSINKAVRTVREFAGIMEDARVDRYRAVVTASAREADNGADFLERIRRGTGVQLESIDGTEEARLVQLAVRSRVNLEGKRALLLDLGGGSLEVSEFLGDQNRFSVSLEIGTVRILESFLHGGHFPITPSEEQVVLEYIERVLDPIASRLRRKRYDVVVGTGGNFEAIAELCPVRGPANPTIDVSRAHALLRRLAKMTSRQRCRVFGLRPDRADTIVPALYALAAVTDLARVSHVVSPGVGLKEGVLFELIEKHFRVWDYKGEENEIVHAAMQLGRRFNFDEAHATQVDRIASRLFDGLLPLHKLSPRDRRALRVASILHDVGDFLQFSSHHKHTQYIIENSDIMGLPSLEKIVVGCIARYHRRAAPSIRHASYKKLGLVDRARVRKLAAILRLADALDRGHHSKIRELGLDVAPGLVTLHVRSDEDMSLEDWTVERKAAVFQSVFKSRVRIVQH